MRWVGRLIYFLLMLIVGSDALWGQACSTLGQTPYSAFPVCGSTDFQQKTVPECTNGSIPTSCPKSGLPYEDKNPYWYKFTCYKSGTLGLLITPNNPKDDYDWQIFDITGHNAGDVYTDNSLIVCYNWSGETGATGTNTTASNLFECGTINSSPIIPTFSKMPDIIQGHEYLLMISHFTGDNQSGYALSFPSSGPNAGTASIINPIIPAIQNAFAVCDGTQIALKLNRRINCATIAADGSDFTVNNGRSPVKAIGRGCLTGFDSDSILITLDKVLSPGTYTLTVKTGTDGNTLADNCAFGVPVGDNASLKFTPAQPTLMDSIVPVNCIKDTLQLVFSKPMMCSSIAADGSDFVINGPTTVNIKSASGICSNGLSTYINILLSSPIRTNGVFTITLKNGSDGNTLIDECSEVTPAGSTLSFTTKNITTADFQANVSAGCKYDTLRLTHNGYGGTTQWQWLIDSAAFSTMQNPVLISRAFGTYRASLSVANGYCTDTSSQQFVLPDRTVRAGFIVADTLCPTDQVQFTDNSGSNVTSWLWKFGNGNSSTSQTPPPQSYPLTGRPTEYIVSLNASNSICSDAYYKIITIVASCYIAVPSAFTPNGDGINDYLYPLNAVDVDNLLFRVYNRYGQLIFESKNYSKKWDGTYKGQPQPSGTYIWTFSYNKRGSSERVDLKGTAVLIR